MSAIQETFSQYLPFLRKKPSVSREQTLRVKPIRNPNLEWDRNDEGEIRLLIPRRKDLLGRVLCRIMHAKEFKELVLDDVGTDIWLLCDGQHNVQSIIAAISDKYKLPRRECEVSVGMYLKTLGERNLLGFQTVRASSDKVGTRRARPAGGRKKK